MQIVYELRGDYLSDLLRSWYHAGFLDYSSYRNVRYAIEWWYDNVTDDFDSAWPSNKPKRPWGRGCWSFESHWIRFMESRICIHVAGRTDLTRTFIDLTGDGDSYELPQGHTVGRMHDEATMAAAQQLLISKFSQGRWVYGRDED